MRHIIYFLLASGLFWAGCAGNATLGTYDTAYRNVDNLAQIKIGMTDKQVFQVMRKPYKIKKIQIEDDRFEVWFYITRPTIMDQEKMVRINLTPLTFKNGFLQSTGYEYYDMVIRKQVIAAKLSQTKPEKEDIQLEKVLQTPPAQAAPAQKGAKNGPKTSQQQQQTTPPAQKSPNKEETQPSQPQSSPPLQTPVPPSGQGSTKPKPSNQPAGQTQSGNVSMSKKIAPADKPPEPPQTGPQQPPAPVQPPPPVNPLAPPPPAEKGGKKSNAEKSKGDTGPVQPQAEQPPAPVQPPAPINPLAPPPTDKDKKKPTPPKSNVSMSKKPEPAEQPPEESAEQDKKKVPLTEKDQQMLDQEQEENFDFW